MIRLHSSLRAIPASFVLTVSMLLPSAGSAVALSSPFLDAALAGLAPVAAGRSGAIRGQSRMSKPPTARSWERIARGGGGNGGRKPGGDPPPVVTGGAINVYFHVIKGTSQPGAI